MVSEKELLIKIKHIILSKTHKPSVIGLVFNPFYLARRSLWNAIGDYSHYMRGELLDVGCGSKPYANLFDVTKYIGLDIDNEHCRKSGIADDYYNGLILPYKDESFDSILCNQVLEHVFFADNFLAELSRVIRPDGILLLTVPFIWDEHEQPNDFARYTTFGLRALLERNGFKVIEQRKLLDNPSIFCQLFNAYVFKNWRTNFRILNIIITLFVVFPLNLLGLVIGYLSGNSPDMFLDQAVIAKRA